MTNDSPGYAMRRVVSLGLEDAEQKVREELATEGFGILSEIDIQQTLKNKLDVDVGEYRILGACNPPLAHRAIETETDIGLLLPCNVVLYAGEQEGTTVVSAINPVIQLGVAGRDDLAPVAEDVKRRLERVLDALGASA